MCHPHVVGNEASRPVITEVLIYLLELETMTTEDEEIQTPKFAIQRVHDILVVHGGRDDYFEAANNFESYSTREDRWTEVSCTQLHSNSALLSNCKHPLNSNYTQRYITQFQQNRQ
jgi:hypothetical protein